MKQIGKRMGALALMLTIAVGSTACSISSSIQYKPVKSNSPTVMTVNGTAISQKEYAAYLRYNMTYFETQYEAYGLTNIWEDPSTAEMFADQLPESTKYMATYLTIMQQKADELGVKVSNEQKQTAADNIKTQIETAGSKKSFWNQIARFGFDEQLYYNFVYTSLIRDAIQDYYYGENGIEKSAEEDILAYFKENYVKAKNILIATTDSSTGEETRTIDEAKVLAEEALAKLDAGESFDAVMQEYNEDPGMESNPNGYVFKNGDMVPEFYTKTTELADGEYGLVETSYGWHIVQRIALDDADIDLDNMQGTSKNRDEITTSMGSINEKIEEWVNAATVETTELYDQITYSNIAEYQIDAPVYTPPETETTTDDSSDTVADDTATDDTSDNVADDAATDTTTNETPTEEEPAA